MPPCERQVNDFELWFSTASDAMQQEALVILRKCAEELGVTVIYNHLAVVEDAFFTKNTFDLLTSCRPQFALN